MTERNARMMGPLFQSCPLCGVTKDHLTVTGRLEDHVLGHLRDLALSSLPYIQEEDQKTNSTNSLNSDDSAKPADRSTVSDLLDEEPESTSEDRQTIASRHVESGPLSVHSDEDPYAAWNGIKNYVQASHTVGFGEPPKQILQTSSDTFPCPLIPDTRDGDESYRQQIDDSSRFVDPYDIIPGVFSDGRSAQVCCPLGPHQITKAHSLDCTLGILIQFYTVGIYPDDSDSV